MSKQILLLVEGQTEERFVKDVLYQEFVPLGVYLQPTILNTKIVKDGPNFKGGVSTFSKIVDDLSRLIHNSGDGLVTTILDYYRLPADVPGMSTRSQYHSAMERVNHVELAIFENLGQPNNFVPFLALHEYEAWLFSCSSTLPALLTSPTKEREFAKVCTSVSSPEEINEIPSKAPSNRILSMFPSYRKTLHGPTAARRIGLELIRLKCPHFDSWLSQLEAFSRR